MASFLVEAYTPQPASLEEIERNVNRAAGDPSTAGPVVRYLRTIYVAEDEICFHMFEAGSVDAVRLATERAEIDAQRIVEAVEIPGGGG
jgi:hypothetical protein